MSNLINDLTYIAKRPKKALKRLISIRDQLSYLTILHEIFIAQAYSWLVSELRPKTVAIDIGAYKGETAIYLAMSKDVERVIAVEPSIDAYTTAKIQVEESGLKDKITLINNYVTGYTKKIEIQKSASPIHRSKSRNGNKESMALKDLISLANSKNIIIKCDTEGSEQEIFKCPPDVLKSVYRIQLEYHDTFPIMRKLLSDAGFRIRQTEDHKGIFYKRVGNILAWK